jgi:predicted amidohydrolase
MGCKIAVVQFESRYSAFSKNLKRAGEFVKKAAKRKADIIVFPENFLSRPINGNHNFVDSKSIVKKYFQKIAKKYSIDIITGSIIEKDFFKRKYNTSYYINSNGKILCKYKKIHLWAEEKKEFSKGNKINVFKTKFGKIGLILCWDLAFSEVFRQMVKKEVDIVICPAHWCVGDAGKGIEYDHHSEIKFVDSLCIERAFENEIIFIFCNTAGKFKIKNKFDISIGHSQITEPFKGVIKKLDHNRESMFVQTINTDILKDTEKSYKIRKDLKK